MNNTIYSRSEYLKRIKKETALVKSVQIFTVVFLLTMWEVAADIGLIDRFILSSPSRMIKMFVQMAAGELWVHIACTVGETLVGFLLGVAIV